MKIVVAEEAQRDTGAKWQVALDACELELRSPGNWKTENVESSLGAWVLERYLVAV